MTDAQARAIRTFAQILIAVAGGAGPVVALFHVTAAQYVAVAGALTGLATLITGVVNALENRGVIPSVLKPEPQPAPPLVDWSGPLTDADPPKLPPPPIRRRLDD